MHLSLAQERSELKRDYEALKKEAEEDRAAVKRMRQQLKEAERDRWAYCACVEGLLRG